MSKLSYAKQVSLARRRLKRLKSEGISNNATKILEVELNTFYKRNNIAKRGNGISIDERMTPSQRKEISNIITSFLDNPTSTLSGIKKAASEITGEKSFSAKDSASIVDMHETVLLSDAALVESFKSQVLNEVYTNQRKEGFDVDAARYALSNYYIEHGNQQGKTVSEIANEVMEYVNDYLDLVPEWQSDYEEW